MSARKISFLIAVVLSLSLVACGSAMDRMILKEAKAHLKGGNIQGAINSVQEVLRMSPNNIMAKRLMGKIKSRLIKEAKQSIEAGDYNGAVEKLDMLQKLDPQSQEAMALYADAKKRILVADAKTALEKDNPMAAVNLLNEALRFDPEFEDAKALQADARKKADERIRNLVKTAEKLVEQKDFEKLRELAQDILTIDPQNAQASELLRSAQAQILSRDREQNLAMARKFFDEGIYESALSKAEEVLKVDPASQEAKQLIEKAKAELSKPQLRLTGLSKLKGKAYAHIEIPSIRKSFKVGEGENFGEPPDFKVSAVDLDLKAVVVTYLKTGSQQTITTAPEPEASPPAPPEEAPKQ